MSKTIEPPEFDSPSALIELAGISIRRGSEIILDKINLSVSKDEIVTLIGPNGAGKSTLVKVALGLKKPNHGTVSTSKSLNIGYVPQSVNLDESLPVSVKRFLKISLKKNTDIDSEDVTGAMNRILDQVGAADMSNKALREISGGEMRRVLLARALLTKPDLLILDEPTSGVDISGQAALYTLIQWIRDEYHCGVLLVSHNLHVVMAATDRVVCLNRHLCCSGTPEAVQQHPEFVSLFGHRDSAELGIYRHHHDHDHDHDLHGQIHRHSQENNLDSKNG